MRRKKKMKTLFEKHKWMQLIYGVLLLAAGIVTIIFAVNDKENVAKTISVVAAIGLFIYSAALLFSGVFSLKKKLFDIAFVFAVIFVSIGVCLVSNPTIIRDFILIFVSTMLLAIGVVEIGEATAMIFFKRPVVFIVVFYLLGAAFITFGVLSIVYKEDVEQIVYVCIGILLCLAAALEIVLGARGLILALKEAKQEKAKVVDAEVSDVPSENKEEEKKDEDIQQIEEKKDNEPVDVIDLDHDDNHSNSNPDA